jgi:hypothetical protein
VYPTSAGTGDAWDDAFPCGLGQLGSSVCAKRHDPFGDVSMVKFGAEFDRPIPLAPKTDARYRFEIGSSTIDLVAHDGAWTLTGSSRARAIIRNNVVFVVAPSAEVGNGDYRVSTSAGGRHDVQPPADHAALPIGSTIAAAGVPGRETAEQFLAGLSTALTNGDAAFLRARLHPAVVDRYGAAACDAFAAGPHTATNIVVSELGPPGTFSWQSDGLARDVPDTNTAIATQNGTSQPIHLALVDGTWRWFADCGTPQAGAR